ncbi:hypothetical protein KBTX_03822 [wastewater metagenome]|uniref:Cytochrome C oxidase subunit IV n=2 Tax=unclassified sequences TaxID=12908 RepID=A0A5B8RFR5_9ZZZZ|nr:MULTISPECIES: cytochrome C oxidase subunit IV family protein [Arhodomonas]MCS4503774.1 cytochrome C oxidase subunit IV family protein [Arhodomonas aquaeolei]QEA07471.1 hypothetical protein KBTEX_03822 [uncultured organism]
MSRAETLSQHWIMLLALTVAAALAATVVPAPWLTPAVAALTVIKGRTVIDSFMGLRGASPLLRHSVSAWLAGVVALGVVIRLT